MRLNNKRACLIFSTLATFRLSGFVKWGFIEKIQSSNEPAQHAALAA
jgi:hypothetical protein